MNRKRHIIRAGLMFNGKKWENNKSIVIEGNKIVDVVASCCRAKYEGIVTPAFIDAHSHIGICRDGEPPYEQEVNDYLDQIQPTLNPVYSLDMEDKAFTVAVDFGMLYSCLVPGSGNLVGGKAIIIKNFVNDTDEAVIKDYGFKMALGYNPRNSAGKQGKRSKTRMGIYSLLENTFDDLLRKKKRLENRFKEEAIKLRADRYPLSSPMFPNQTLKKKLELELTNNEKGLLEILSGKKTVKIHVHQENDVNFLIHLVKKYKLKATAEHTCDVHHAKYFKKLADNNIPIVYGPFGQIGSKTELKNYHYSNTKLLIDSGAFYGLMSDHPIIHTMDLRDCLKFFLYYGMSDEDALSLLTYRNAKILNLDKILGTLEPGKLASLIVWDRYPLLLGAKPVMVMGEGKILRENHIQ